MDPVCGAAEATEARVCGGTQATGILVRSAEVMARVELFGWVLADFGGRWVIFRNLESKIRESRVRVL
jgi:hypothetical protein